MRPEARPRLGALAIALYLPHAIWHIAHHTTWDLLWGCNLAMPLLALGCLLGNGRLVTTAFLFLAFGTPTWLLDVVLGGAWVPTSPLVHVGGLATAVAAVRAIGWPPRTWLFALALSSVILGLSYLVTPPAANINLVFAVYEGWEGSAPRHRVYLAMLWLAAAGMFWLLERFARRRQVAA